MKTHNFLEALELKNTICEQSADARELYGELEGYVMFTKGDQEQRVTKVSSGGVRREYSLCTEVLL